MTAFLKHIINLLSLKQFNIDNRLLNSFHKFSSTLFKIVALDSSQLWHGKQQWNGDFSLDIPEDKALVLLTDFTTSAVGLYSTEKWGEIPGEKYWVFCVLLSALLLRDFPVS